MSATLTQEIGREENKTVMNFEANPDFVPLFADEIKQVEKKIRALKNRLGIEEYSWVEKLNWLLRDDPLVYQLYKSYGTVWTFISKESISKKERAKFKKLVNLYDKASNSNMNTANLSKELMRL